MRGRGGRQLQKYMVDSPRSYLQMNDFGFGSFGTTKPEWDFSNEGFNTSGSGGLFDTMK